MILILNKYTINVITSIRKKTHYAVVWDLNHSEILTVWIYFYKSINIHNILNYNNQNFRNDNKRKSVIFLVESVIGFLILSKKWL